MSEMKKITAKELKEMLGTKALNDEELGSVVGGSSAGKLYNSNYGSATNCEAYAANIYVECQTAYEMGFSTFDGCEALSEQSLSECKAANDP